jgi:tetratricopeptide (TPR) repeat protein
VRIDARLVDPSSSTDLWAASYTRRLSTENVFEIQAEVAREVARALQVSLSPEVDARFGARTTESIEAHDLYVRGRALYETGRSDNVFEAERLFRGAVQVDSTYSLPWAGLALAAARRTWGMGLERGWADSSLVYATRAARMGPPSATVQWGLAGAYSALERKRQSVEEYERALELDPYHLATLNNLGFEYRRLGRFDRAIPLLLRAHSVALNHPNPPANLSASFRALGMLREAEAWAERSRRNANTGSSQANFAAAQNAIFQGDPVAAMEIAIARVAEAPEGPGVLMQGAEVAYLARDFERASEWSRGAVARLAPDNIWRNSEHGSQVLLGLSLMLAGEGEEGADILGAAIEYNLGRIEKGAEFWLFPFGIATAHAALGEADAAFQWLERSYDAGFRWVELARLDPALDGLRDDPRYEGWIGRIEQDIGLMRERVRNGGLELMPR